MVRLRRLLFYGFTVAYFVVCPWTILYALGYVVRPDGGHGFVRTGAIAIGSVPQDATVYVNGRRFTERTPTAIRNLLPGSYDLRVIRPRYRPWERTIVVEAERVAAQEHVLLLPERETVRTVLEGPFEGAIAVPDTEFLLLRSGPSAGEWVIFDWRQERSRPLVSSAGRWGGLRVRDVLTVRGSPVVLCRMDGRSGERMVWINLRDSIGRERELRSRLHHWPDQAAWDPDDPGVLWAMARGRLSRLSLRGYQPMTRVAEGVQGIGVFERQAYVLQEGGVFSRWPWAAARGEVLLDDPELGKRLFRAGSTYVMARLSEGLVLFLGQHGDLVANRVPYRFAERGILGIEPDASGQRVLVWTRRQLGVLDFSQPALAGALFEAAPHVTWHYRGRELRGASWVYEGSHAMVLEGDEAVLVDLSAPADAAGRSVLRVARDSGIRYVEETGELLYLDPDRGALEALALVPRRDLLDSWLPAGQADGTSGMQAP